MTKNNIRISRFLFSVVISLLIFTSSEIRAQEQKVEFVSVDELKIGQRGECLTVLKGNKIEKVPVEILGVLKNVFGFNRDLILVKFSHPILDKAGVISGMSGSPVFIDKKLIGALAYADNFGKEPIGYLTPIKDILNIKNEANKFILPQFKEGARNSLLFASRGFNQEVFNFIFKIDNRIPFNFIPQITGQKNQNIFSFGNSSDIQSGSMIGVQLMRGDFDLSAFGTVVLRDGQFLYLFGHPLQRLGNIEYPLIKADVLDIFPSYENSYKITNQGEFIGTVIYDGSSGLLAELGRKPNMTPITIDINSKNFYIEVVKNNLLTPVLIEYAVLNSIFYEASLENMTLSIRETLKIKNYSKNIEMNKIYSGNYVMVLQNLLQDMIIHDSIINNDFFDTQIEKIDFGIKILPNRQELKIVSLIPNTFEISKGSDLDLSIGLNKFNNGIIFKNISLKFPKTISDASITIEAANKPTNFVSKWLSRGPFSYTSFDDFIKEIEEKEGLYLLISGAYDLDKIVLKCQNCQIRKVDIEQYNQELNNFTIFEIIFDDLKNYKIFDNQQITIGIN